MNTWQKECVFRAIILTLITSIFNERIYAWVGIWGYYGLKLYLADKV